MAFGLAVLWPLACASDPAPSAPTRACGVTVWHRPASSAAAVEIVGDWDGWKRPGVAPGAREDGWRVAAFDVAPGEHAYAIIEDGVWLTDKNVPMTAFHEGREVALVEAADCGRPLVRVDDVRAEGSGHAVVKATFLAARSGVALDPASITAVTRDGTRLTVTSSAPESGAIELAAEALPAGKHVVTISAKDTDHVVAEDARATVWVEPWRKDPWDPRDAVVYQVLVDRFRNGDGPLAPPATPSSRAGGNLAGVRRAIESGELEALGVNTLWLSPLYKNPEGTFPGNDGRLYSSYHGYWPVASRELDARVTTEGELDAFMALAHSRGLRVLFDVVPNHVHSEHRWTTQHADWFPKGCVCGQGACDWGTNIKTCWFAPYLPDLDWKRDDVARAETAEVMWWMDRWDADGLRIDAVPMMPRAATRRITTAVRSRFEHPGHHPYVLGENFTGPGGYQSLRYDLGPYGLDGSFHFPLMWTLRSVVAEERSPMSAIDTSYRAGEEAWAGSGAVMGLMIGNHDVSRFASVSAGSANGDAWEPTPQPVDPAVYAKQRLALATVLTLPGAPVLYYGDEVGLAGRSDPDCRRVMPREQDLLPAQAETRALARTLGRARSCSKALRRGDVRTLLADDERFVFARTTEDDLAIVVLTRRPTLPTVVPLAGLPVSASDLVDVVTGTPARLEPGGIAVANDPLAVHVYVPNASRCAVTQP